jgi:sugar phosphate permease
VTSGTKQQASNRFGGALPRTVVVLGLVSLLNDAASEMITPLLPIFLTATLGAGPAIVGFVEGLAEATASVLKLVSGRLADRGVPAKGLVVGGYALSNLGRPLIGLATGWAAVLLLRFLDRVGKGLRTAPRDALIASAVAPGQRGRAFGFHR